MIGYQFTASSDMNDFEAFMKNTQLHRDKENTVENLRAIQLTLDECESEGMMDEDDHFYNELLSLIDEANLVETEPELDEVISKAKTLEVDIDAWLSMHRHETLSLTWPRCK